MSRAGSTGRAKVSIPQQAVAWWDLCFRVSGNLRGQSGRGQATGGGKDFACGSHVQAAGCRQVKLQATVQPGTDQTIRRDLLMDRFLFSKIEAIIQQSNDISQLILCVSLGDAARRRGLF